MLKKEIFKKVSICVAVATLVLSTGVDVKASDDNVAFSFNLKANYANTYSSKRYRQTKSTSNKWKVDMTYNAEGEGTKATYWLAKYNSDHTRVSDTHTIKQGSGAHYYKAYADASQMDVCLGAENNNNTSKTYIVSGYWDEETN